MKFGIFIGGATHVDVIPKIVVATEKLGYDSFWVSDHLFLPDRFYEAVGMKPGKGESPVLEAWTTMAMAAAVTQKLKLGVGVTPIPMRNPAVLAKQVATIDFVSKGRVTLGCGAGWHRREFEAYGIPWDNHKVRIAKMLEGLEVLKRLWTDNFASFNGKYYKLRDAPLWPKPVQKPHPPIWFGGLSSSIMKATAKYGSGWVPYCLSPSEFRTYHKMLVNALEKNGRKLEEVTLACVVLAHLDSSHQAARKFAEPILKIRGTRTLTGEKWDTAAGRSVIGSLKECISKIEEYEKAGVQHLLFEMIYPKTVHSLIQRFGKEVLPAFK